MTPNLIEVTLTPDQLKQLTEEHKLTVCVRVAEPQGFGLSGSLFVTLRINQEDDGRSAVTRVIDNPVTLSSGTQVMEYAMKNGATDAVSLPDNGCSMAEADWKEYEAYVSSLSLSEARQRRANRRPESERGHTTLDAVSTDKGKISFPVQPVKQKGK